MGTAAAQPYSPRDLWPQATAALESGDLEGAETRLGELLELGRGLGLRRFPLYADSAAAIARQASAQGNDAVAGWALDAARRLDPISPNVAFTAADIARNRGEWGMVVTELLRGIRNVSLVFRTRALANADLALVAMVSLALTAVIFTGVLFLRYRRAVLHEFREILGHRLSPGATSVLALALLLLPLFLWLGTFWLLFYLLALFFLYATLRERIIIVAILVTAALLPLWAEATAFRIVAVDHPVVRAAVANHERSYDFAALRRLRELSEIMPENARIQLLLGNMELNEGNDQQAGIHFRRAAELDDRLAGAFINIGNLHFVNNDFAAAMSQYERASQVKPDKAIAYYNQSVASGEMYRFDLQGQRLVDAKRHDRALVERVLRSPNPQKVIRYHLPLDEAWSMSRQLGEAPGAREIFGTHASFDPSRVTINPMTIAAVLALIGALGTFAYRRKSGFAGSCIKCGRSFCPRCKSARESASYCTQCIHIYLKRDGVSIDTKRQKVQEVQSHQHALIRHRRTLAVFFPGAGQIHEGAVLRGVAALFLAAFLICLAVLIGRLAPIAWPAETMKLTVRAVSIFLAVVIWLTTLIPVFRQRPAA